MFEKIKEVYSNAKDYVKDLAIRTKMEIAAGVLIGTVALGSIGHTKETRRSLFQPISFSEYEQMEDIAHEQNRDLNELTWFYTGVNDFSAKIMEAYNWDNILGAVPELHRDRFSKKLEQAMDTTGRLYRRNIRDFARIIPQHARGALRELSDLTSASQESRNLNELFGQTWDYDYTESGHWYPVETCSGSGDDRTCTTTMHYQCDNYHHTWTYHPAEGVRASQGLIRAKQRVPEIKHLEIETPRNTNAWNEQVVRQSFRRMHDREPTEAEMLHAAQLYKTGSQYELNIDNARGLWSQFTGSDMRTWQNYLATAKTTSKTTGCHSTNGPIEYEFSRDIRRRLDQFVEHEQNITNGMRYAIENVPDLENEIKIFFLRQNPTMRAHFPEIADSQIRGSKGKLSREIISGARMLYGKNIPNGNPDTSYRLEILFIYSLLGAVLGGLAGLGADSLVDKYVAQPFRESRSY